MEPLCGILIELYFNHFFEPLWNCCLISFAVWGQFIRWIQFYTEIMFNILILETNCPYIINKSLCVFGQIFGWIGRKGRLKISNSCNVNLQTMPSFSWSIFIRTVIDHMICYNLKWPKIKLWVQYFVFSCGLQHILKSYKSIFQPFTRLDTF